MRGVGDVSSVRSESAVFTSFLAPSRSRSTTMLSIHVRRFICVRPSAASSYRLLSIASATQSLKPLTISRRLYVKVGKGS